MIMKRVQLGFTLIELMIAVAIIGILSSIAIPSYQDSVKKSRRADAKAALLGLANALERRFTETNSYCDVGGGTGTAVTDCGTATLDTGTPTTIYTVPTETAGFYTVTISAATTTTYTLSAVPAGAQSGDRCGTLTLTGTGAKTFSGSGLTVAECW
jgi:type IV pilus assembly protein PilE